MRVFQSIRILSISIFGSMSLYGVCGETLQGYERRFVIEELTGTWCGYCPIGTAVMEYMHAEYGDRFIGIALHSQGGTGEPMVMSDGSYINTLMAKHNVSGLPSVVLNRETGDIQPYDALSWYAERTDEPAPQRVVLENVSYNPNLGNDVYVAFNIESFQDTQLNVSVALVCTEDHVKGEDPKYSQLSYYHKNYGQYKPADLRKMYPDVYAYLEKFVTGECDAELSSGRYTYSISYLNMEYNDVARGIFPSYGGKSYSGVYEGGIPKRQSLTFTMPDNVLNPENTAITALLIDNKTGKVINADRIPAASYDTSEVAVMVSDDAKYDPIFYTLDGVRVDHPVKGVYIVRYPDGHSRKVIY